MGNRVTREKIYKIKLNKEPKEPKEPKDIQKITLLTKQESQTNILEIQEENARIINKMQNSSIHLKPTI